MFALGLYVFLCIKIDKQNPRYVWQTRVFARIDSQSDYLERRHCVEMTGNLAFLRVAQRHLVPCLEDIHKSTLRPILEKNRKYFVLRWYGLLDPENLEDLMPRRTPPQLIPPLHLHHPSAAFSTISTSSERIRRSFNSYKQGRSNI